MLAMLAERFVAVVAVGGNGTGDSVGGGDAELAALAVPIRGHVVLLLLLRVVEIVVIRGFLLAGCPLLA